MATVKELLTNPGPYITALLPDIQELVQSENPYLINEAASLIWRKMLNWGGTRRAVSYDGVNVNKQVREGDKGQEMYQKYPAATSDLTRQYADAAIIKNMALKLESLPMAEVNSWLEFQKMIDLFYSLLDPVTYFRLSQFECPPDLEPCFDVKNNYYLQRIGIYERPRTMTGTEGTGFGFYEERAGTATLAQKLQIGFIAPRVSLLECPPDLEPCFSFAPLEGRYFALWYTADDVDVFWYRVDGAGEVPTFGSATGVTNYIAIDIPDRGKDEDLLELTLPAIDGTGRWVTSRPCPPGELCIWKVGVTVTQVTPAVSKEPEDGLDGLFKVVTTMNASDGTEIATGLVSDQAWQNAHNDMRVPYERDVLGRRVMNLKAVEDIDGDCDECPCCDAPGSPSPCKACFVFLQTPFIGVLEDLPVNVPGVVNDNRTSDNLLFVTD